MIQTNLLGRFGTAVIWSGINTNVEVVGTFLNMYNPKHPELSLVVRILDGESKGDLKTVNHGSVNISA